MNVLQRNPNQRRRCRQFDLLISVCLWCFVAGWPSLLPAQEEQPPAAIKVMSFNIRYGIADDGPNHWDRRREKVVELIRHHDPDLLGIQESLAFQTDYLKEQLPGFEVIGVGRDDGQRKGEMTALLFRQERFEALESGHFWLSETPQVPGSKSWDSSLTRMASWVRLKDRQTSGLPAVFFLNTHFDHIGRKARVESARLIRQMLIKQSVPSNRFVITGDFNADEGSGPYQALLNLDPPNSQDLELKLVDTFRQVHPDPLAQEGTFSNFQSKPSDGARIDWIVVSADWKIEAASIDRTEHEGRTPSDHFPVLATIRLAQEAAGK